MSKKTTDETLGREAVKEYLQQYHTAVGKKRILEERHRVLSSELRAPSTGSAFRLTPPTKPTKTDGSVSVVFRISEVEDRIEEQREEMAKAVLNVMDLIDVLPANSTERTVVEMRHIDCRGWDKIAEALYMSRSNVFNYYNAALDKILENKRNRKLLEEGKELTQNGISTAVAWGGEWVLWGDHTAAYTYGADVDPRAIFDVSMRMLMHITNDFQREWSPRIDEPMTRALKDEIINREQEKLDGYVSMGALLGEPQIVFLESENSTTDIMNGDFRWDIAVTPTPPLKSASVYVAYTDAGFSVYYEGGDE